MKKLEFKQKILTAAREKQQALIDDFKSRIEEIKNGEVMVNEDQLDSGQRGNDDAGNEMINNLADQLNFAVEEMDILNKMRTDLEPLDEVTIGAVVKTNRNTFFPSVSLEKFEVEGQELFGLSEKAPLYQMMKGKKVGDSFEYNIQGYEVLEVY